MSTVKSYMPDTVAGMPRASLLAQAADLLVSQQTAGLGALTGYCARPRDANASQLCERLATLLLDKADSLASLRAGVAAAGSAESLAAKAIQARKEYEGLKERDILGWSAVQDPSRGCAGIEWVVERLEFMAEAGELQGLRTYRRNPRKPSATYQ
jgi:hypothetical protein